ncbi:hypothetical protein F908_00796 [Acinetobacter sp. NIPH 284]|uniref:5'-methylthioadenosine/S-adenosylhomocysteine nucleosidase family protein n=1 Tax=Acinetobacter sp. NIPH 284 TaxID=1217704 RepID=UPI0002CF6A6C|nr:hypothetical protein [Acinetobacter sp. NIPH 284]ENW83894.1 hypothetical protein F908_00796 [Acinetobacter sp. NIPH 284]
MKILIAVEQPPNYTNLCNRLYGLGISKTDINVVSSVTDTTTYLEKYDYDLLIIDLFLPNFTHERATDINSSLDLLERIKIDNTIKRPENIIGVSSNISLIESNESIFTEMSWSIILYEAHTDKWMNTIISHCEYKRSIQLGRTTSTTNTIFSNVPIILIVCALEKETLHLLNKPWKWEQAMTIDGIVYTKGSFLDKNSIHRNVILCTIDQMGMVASAVYTSRLISKFKVELLCMIGICAGVPQKTNFGDIIFADNVWNYQSGKLILDPENNFSILKSRPHYIEGDIDIRSSLIAYKRNNKTFIKSLKKQKFRSLTQASPEIRFGNIASGSTVLADGITIEQILDQDGNTLAVEMEIYGLFAAANWADKLKKPKFFALKSVCDFADPNKADIAQEYAILTSTEILFDFLTKYVHEII